MQRNQWVIWLVVLTFLGFLALGLSRRQQDRPKIGEIAPDITLQFYQGYEWRNQAQSTLQTMRGQPVVLNFWASWCAPCREEAAILEGMWRDYAPRGVQFVGVAWSDTDRQAMAYLEEYGITYPNAPDLQLAGAEAYRIQGVPESFFLDAQGRVVRYHEGPLDRQTLETYLQELLP